MHYFLGTYAISGVLLAVLDLIWLKVRGESFRVRCWSRTLFYLIYTLGLTFLVTYPLLLTAKCPMPALWKGAMLGLTAGVAAQRPHLGATDRWRFILIELIWMAFWTALVSIATFLITKHLLGWNTVV